MMYNISTPREKRKKEVTNMSIIIECDKKILQAFPMMYIPAMQFMYTNCVRQALQALNHPVRCKEIRKWIYENSDITYDITITMVSSCC